MIEDSSLNPDNPTGLLCGPNPERIRRYTDAEEEAAAATGNPIRSNTNWGYIAADHGGAGGAARPEQAGATTVQECGTECNNMIYATIFLGTL